MVFESREKLLAELEKTSAEARQALESATDEQLLKPWKLSWGERSSPRSPSRPLSHHVPQPPRPPPRTTQRLPPPQRSPRPRTLRPIRRRTVNDKIQARRLGVPNTLRGHWNHRLDGDPRTRYRYGPDRGHFPYGYTGVLFGISSWVLIEFAITGYLLTTLLAAQFLPRARWFFYPLAWFRPLPDSFGSILCFGRKPTA